MIEANAPLLGCQLRQRVTFCMKWARMLCIFGACRFCLAWRLSSENAQNIVLHFFWTDIDVIRPENLMEFVLVEKTEG